ncbi:hypothetical protein SAY86_009910 [Trapa natans]|nr:hypothetical protein SAY86_009910 [Trapa natans]
MNTGGPHDQAHRPVQYDAAYVPPPMPVNPTLKYGQGADFPQAAYNPHQQPPTNETTSKGDGFCRGLCAGLCCYCCLDICF